MTRAPDVLDLSEVLSEFARTMVTDFPIQAILDRLVERIVEILPVSGAGVTLISPGVEPRYVAASDRSALRFEQLQTELNEGPCVWAYQTGEAVTVADLIGESRFPHFSPRALEAGLRAVFTFPLRHGASQLGALDLYRDTAGALSAPAVTAAQTLADVAAAYLLNAQARDDLQRASLRSRRAALYDPLTGLPNRVLLLERLAHALQRARRSRKATAVVSIDINRFQAINDRYGHQIGDELLIAVGQRLTDRLRPGDTLARLSGDEFVVLCEDLEAAADTAPIAARLTSALRQPFALSVLAIEVTASVGASIADGGDNGPSALLHDAGTARYHAKQEGDGHHHILEYSPQRLDGPTSLSVDLAGAAGRGELHLHYRPVVATTDSHLTGLEGLLHWAHPERGTVTPATLLPLAEQTGLIAEIGPWVLRTAWVDRRRWSPPGPHGHLTMAIKASAHQLMTAGFTQLVASTIPDDTDPTLLTLELSETVLADDSQRALTVTHDLKEIGVTLTLDAFGTGHSSLAYLEQFPIDIIKIDRTLTARLGQSPAIQATVSAIIQLAHTLDMTVTVDGIETAEQHLRVALLGCDSSQGNYFAPPMTPADLDHLIGTHPRYLQLPFSTGPENST